jgi:hypothetical protein
MAAGSAGASSRPRGRKPGLWRGRHGQEASSGSCMRPAASADELAGERQRDIQVVTVGLTPGALTISSPSVARPEKLLYRRRHTSHAPPSSGATRSIM